MFRFCFSTCLIFLALSGAAFAEGGFDPVAATDQYLQSLSVEDKNRSDAYFEGGYWLILWNFVYMVGATLLILRYLLSVKIRDLAERTSRRIWLQVPTFVALFSLLEFVLYLPISIYENFYREHQYDLSNMSFGAWFGDEMISIVVGIIALSIGLSIFYPVIRKTGRNWWIWGTGVLSVMIVLMLVVSPVFIQPLFNEYTEMEDGPLKQEILSMAQANGIKTDHIYQVNESKQSDRISANVSGLFGTMRIALNDNLLNQSTPEEVKGVMAHEIGHYAMGQIYDMLIYFTLLFMFGFIFVDKTYSAMITRYGEKWQIRGLGDIAGWPVFLLLLGTYMFVMTPVLNGIIRTHESKADQFAINLTHQPDAFAAVAMKTSTYRKVDPGYWEELIFYDHPSPKSRVMMAMNWKAAMQQSGEVKTSD